MHEWLTRLVRTKTILASLTLSTSGIALMVIGNQTAGWWDHIPFQEIGGVLIGAGILSIWIDRFLKHEQQAQSDARLRQILTDHAPLMRDAVLQAFAADHQDLHRVATPQTLDRIITSSLSLRLDDQQFAAEIYNDLRSQAIESSERWHDANLHINLDPLDGHPDYFSVTVHWEYQTIPSHPERRFLCLSDRQEYAEIATSNSDTSAWYLKPNKKFDANDKKAYELLQFSVNGEQRKIRRSTRKGYQAYTVNVGLDDLPTDEPATISYTYRTITRRDGNLLFFDIEQPTRDTRISFDYSSCNLNTVSVVDLIPSVRSTRIEHSPEPGPPEIIRVDIDGWTFPRSGVAFVWGVHHRQSPGPK